MSSQYDVFDVVCPYCGETSFGILLKPNTTHRIVCPKCKQATYVKILENLSIQIYREDEICPECKGTGYVTCPKCGGEKYIIKSYDLHEEAYKVYPLTRYPYNYIYHGSIMGCPLCGGNGSVMVGDEYYPRAIEKLNKVSIMGGSGRVVCSRCGGNGFISLNEKPSK